MASSPVASCGQNGPFGFTKTILGHGAELLQRLLRRTTLVGSRQLYGTGSCVCADGVRSSTD